MNKKYFEENKAELLKVVEKLDILGIKIPFDIELEFDGNTKKYDEVARALFSISGYFGYMGELVNDMRYCIEDERESE